MNQLSLLSSVQLYLYYHGDYKFRMIAALSMKSILPKPQFLVFFDQKRDLSFLYLYSLYYKQSVRISHHVYKNSFRNTFLTINSN